MSIDTLSACSGSFAGNIAIHSVGMPYRQAKQLQRVDSPMIARREQAEIWSWENEPDMFQ
jgi:hypothetical protein